MSQGMNFSLMISLPLATFFFFEAHDVVALIAGPGYEDAVAPTIILEFALIAMGFTQVIGIQVLTPLGKESRVLVSVVCGAVVDVVLNAVLIPAYGVVGVAVATLVAEFVVLVVQVRFSWDYLRAIRKNLRFGTYLIANTSSMLGCMLVNFAFLEGFEMMVARILILIPLFGAIYALVLLGLREGFVVEGVGTMKMALRNLLRRESEKND